VSAQPKPRERVVILGGGFGGVAAARALRGAPVDITLIDKRNHHLFQPLLYQVAGAVLSPSDIASPLRSMFSGQKNLMVLLGEATEVSLAERRVTVRGPDGGLRDSPYDRLIIAAGMTNSWFGRDAEWAPHAPGMKDLDDALDIRRRVLGAFERAEWTEDREERRRLLTFVVVGGGPTGVEMAGALSEIARRSLAADFRRIDPTDARVVLIEANTGILPPYPSELRLSAMEQLVALGVEVRLGYRVSRIDEGGVNLALPNGPEERIETRTVVWAAGLKGAPLAGTLGVESDRAGRPKVLPDLSIPGHPEAFVIGDLAWATDPQGQPFPGVAQNAIQGGDYVGRLISAEVAAVAKGRPAPPRGAYAYRDLGSMATIGRSKAIASVAGMQFSGRFAWLLWLFIHIMALVGFRNRVLVWLQWSWSYLTWQRHARIIRDRE
jgi:NADH dehydrogenase